MVRFREKRHFEYRVPAMDPGEFLQCSRRALVAFVIVGHSDLPNRTYGLAMWCPSSRLLTLSCACFAVHDIVFIGLSGLLNRV